MSLSFAEGRMAQIRKRIAAAESALGMGVALNRAELRIYDADLKAVGRHPTQIARSAVLFSLVAIPVGRFLTNAKPLEMWLPPLEDEELGCMLACLEPDERAEYVGRLDAVGDRMAPPTGFPLMAATPPPEVVQ